MCLPEDAVFFSVTGATLMSVSTCPWTIVSGHFEDKVNVCASAPFNMSGYYLPRGNSSQYSTNKRVDEAALGRIIDATGLLFSNMK